MPVVKIEMYKGFDAQYKGAILESIHEALVWAFKIPDDDRNQIITERDETLFERSGGKTKQFLIIEIVPFKGRSRDAKRNLYKRIVENLERSPGIKPSDTLIYINEIDVINWGIEGGRIADEVQLGFKIDV